MNLTATSSPVFLSRISLATPKLPEPMSRSCSVDKGARGGAGGRPQRRTAAQLLTPPHPPPQLPQPSTAQAPQGTTFWASPARQGGHQPPWQPPVLAQPMPRRGEHLQSHSAGCLYPSRSLAGSCWTLCRARPALELPVTLPKRCRGPQLQAHPDSLGRVASKIRAGGWPWGCCGNLELVPLFFRNPPFATMISSVANQ